MRRLLTLLTIVCVIITPQLAKAQTQQQQVVVKTRGRIYANDNYRPGVRVPEAYVKVRGDKSYESDARGEIRFGVSSEGYTIEEIKKTGYTLSDADILFREQKYTSTPLYILLENSADLAAYRREIERQVRRNYQATLDVKQAEIERLRAEGKATAEELERLQAEIDRSWDLAEQYVDEMTEHYLLIDFDDNDEFDREMSTYILAGKLDKADSLLATRGDLEEDIRKVKVAEQALEHAKDDAVRRCYYKYEIASQRHERDSAAYWLEQRASLDRENVDWQLEAASYVLDFLGDYDRVLNIYKPTLEYCKEHYGELHEKTTTLYNNIGMVYKNKGEYDNALAYLNKAREIFEKVLDPQHPDLATTYNNIGLVYCSKGQYDEALKYYNKSLEIREKVLKSKHPDLATIYNNIGLVYDAKDQYASALEYYEKAHAIWVKVLDPQHPKIASLCNNVGSVYGGIGQYEKALEYYNKSKEIFERILHPQHPDLATIYNNIGWLYSNMDLYDDALEYYNKAKEIYEQVLDPLHPYLVSLYNSIGEVYTSKGLYDNALRYYNKSCEIREKVLDPLHPDLASSYNNIGMVYYNLGLCEEALQYYKKCLEIQKKALDPQHLYLAATYYNIGWLYSNMGLYDDALEYLDKALVIFEKSNYSYAQTVKTRIEQTRAQMEKQ